MSSAKLPPTQPSFVISALLAILTLSLLQMNATFLASTPKLTILGGVVSSVFFFFLVIAITNFETMVFTTASLGWLEVSIALVASLVAAGSVHRVCITVCFICSCAMLAWINRVSKLTYAE